MIGTAFCCVCEGRIEAPARYCYGCSRAMIDVLQAIEARHKTASAAGDEVERLLTHRMMWFWTLPAGPFRE